MADILNDLQLFTAIVNAGAITRAAMALNSSPPAVSRRLAALEKRLGVRLIERHARRFKLTEAGQTFHDRALRILADLEDAEAEASSHAHRLKGRLIMCFDSHWSVSWYAVYPHRRVQPAKIKALLDYLAERRMARQST